MLEDFDHLYRYSAPLDRLEGNDANNITHCYTDIVPGRPTVVEHQAPRMIFASITTARRADLEAARVYHHG